MLPLVLQSPKAAILAAAFGSVSVYSLHRLYDHLSSISLNNNTALCGSKFNWNWSFDNDCFHTGYLWPATFLLFGCISALSFFMCLVLPAKSDSRFTSNVSSPFSFLSIGNMLVPVRHPPGHTIVIDNRRHIGICTVFLLAIQTAFYYTLMHITEITNENGSKDYLYSKAITQLSVLVLLLSLVCLVAFWCNNHMTYAGLFPSIIPAAVGLQLISGLCEMYFSFFTDKNFNVPIIGTDASARSNLLVLTTLFNVVLMFLFSLVQWRPIFYYPLNNALSSSMAMPWLPLTDVGNNDLDNNYTPLAHINDQRVNNLIDTPEQNTSFFDKLTFSWTSGLLKRGAKSTFNYSDLYNLKPKDMPVINWSRYQHQRKLGRSLLTALSLTFAPELLTQFALTMTRSVLRYASPFFLQRILHSIEYSQQGLLINNIRSNYLDVAGLVFFTLLSAAVFNHSLWIGRRLSMRLKGLLVSELTTKTLHRCGKGVPNKDIKSKSQKENIAATDGKVMNILTADFQTVANTISSMDNMYTPPFLLAIGMWYMYKLLGVSSLVGLLVTVLYIPLSKVLLTQSRKLKSQQSKASDKRIAAITEAFQGIKAIKLFGWESRFLERIDEYREKQLSYTWKVFLWTTCATVSSYISPVIILVMMFTSYIMVFGNTLNAETAFTSIVVFQMVRSAIHATPKNINMGVSAYVSILRIDSYLQQQQTQDLEERMLLQDVNSELGFDCADLEWSIVDSTTANAQSSDLSSSIVSTDASSTGNSQTVERTPLLASTSNTPILQVNDQESIRRFSLKDINVRFPLGQLSIVAGPTGSGKSSLLSALVGEMNLVRGSILFPTIDSSTLADNHPNYQDIIKLSHLGATIHDIAYVAQDAWLRNATIRENILFGEPYNRERYEEVLHICALKPDLRILAAGDMSEIGERGITLSGGQKQRVALARAVYSSRRILLIDDCLSAVDAHTEKHILVECLSGNSKIMYGRTRVLVTHHVAMCLPYSQYMVMINNGRITLKGSPDELRSSNSLLPTLIESLNIKSDNKETQAKDVYDRKSEDEYNKEHLQKLAIKKGINPDIDLSMLQGVLIKDEERERGYVKFNVWKTFMDACGGKMFWSFLVMFLVLDEAIVALRNYWVKLWVESANTSAFGTNTLNSGTFVPLNRHSAVYWLGFYMLFGIANVVRTSLFGYTMFTGKVAMARKMHRRLIRRVVHAMPRFHESTPIGRIISRFSRDMNVIDNSALDNLMVWFSEIARVVATYVIISAAIPAFAIAAIVITSIFATIVFYYLNTSRELKRLESNSMSPLLSLFSEIINGTTTISAFGVKHLYIKEAINRISAHNRPFYGVWSTNRWLFVRVITASTFIVGTTATFILFNLDWINAGMAGFILTYAMSFSEYMLWTIQSYGTNEMNMNAIERVMQYLDIDQEAALETDSENKPPATWPRKGELRVKDLVVEYVPGAPVLHGVSLSVKHGENIGIVGRTGAGKSTISLALLRFLEASKGQIVLDGVDISKIGLEDLRRNVTIIPQDPVLFNGTIRFNLDPFEEHPDELLWEALHRTCLVNENNGLAASANMAGIFKSLNAEIKENGSNLSAGQRQLVALARALVRRSKLIIMDEATASVDFDTDSRIQDTIRGPEFANSTLLCIAHRLRTVIDYDKVLVLDNGRVAEYDTPHNLLQIKDGIFRSMCEEAGEYTHMGDSAAFSSHAF